MSFSKSTAALLCAAFLASGNLVSSRALAESGWLRLPNGVMGCKTQEQLLKFVTLLNSGDKEAAYAYFRSENTSYNCILINKGEVHVDDVYPPTGAPVVSCLRPRGMTTCYWVPSSTF